MSGSGTATLSGTYPSRPLRQVIDYDANDHAISIDDGTIKTEETLSPDGRVLRRKIRDSATAEVHSDVIFGYDGAGDSPSYSRPAAGGAVTTFVRGPRGLLATYVGTEPSYPITNAHGDTVGTTNSAGAFTPNPLADEFGVSATAPPQYGWLGDHQRMATGGNLQLLRMGVRLYDPQLGPFLQVDPIEGGSCNDYDYSCADPINKVDLAGTFHYTLNFNLGATSLSASAYMSMVAANFGDLFPIGGAPDTLPGVGANVGLGVGPVPFPVTVSSRSATGWTFGTRPGHPDHKGWVSFRFTKSRGRMRLQVRAYVPDYSLGACPISVGCWAFRKRIYRGVASRTWTPFADNLRAQGW